MSQDQGYANGGPIRVFSPVILVPDGTKPLPSKFDVSGTYGTNDVDIQVQCKDLNGELRGESGTDTVADESWSVSIEVAQGGPNPHTLFAYRVGHPNDVGQREVTIDDKGKFADVKSPRSAGSP